MTNTESDWTIELTIGNPPEVINVVINEELRLGRSDGQDTSPLGLNLNRFNGGEMGVSRQHAAIRSDGNRLFIVDLNSGNGTVLNGTRMIPDTPYQLTDGDIIYLGHLQINLHISHMPKVTNVRAKRNDINLNTNPPAGAGQRVLVVEDDPALAALYQVGLEKARYTVQICRDVVSAIRALNQTTPALILLDLMLPGVHGLELCRYVRRDTAYPSVPIVVLTAVVDNAMVKQAMEAGADVFINKPTQIRELVRVVGALIHQEETSQPVGGTKKLVGTASLDHITTAPRRDTVIIFVEGNREPIGVVVPVQVTLGRQRPNGSSYPHVDLEEAGAFNKGVSRLHAVIKRQGSSFVIEDLGSANGTFVNGHSLAEREIQPIKNGDELRLGELRMHIYMLAETTVPSDVPR